jgi:hypothetical protein
MLFANPLWWKVVVLGKIWMIHHSLRGDTVDVLVAAGGTFL